MATYPPLGLKWERALNSSSSSIFNQVKVMINIYYFNNIVNEFLTSFTTKMRYSNSYKCHLNFVSKLKFNRFYISKLNNSRDVLGKY